MTPETKQAIEQVFDELFAMPTEEFHQQLAKYENTEFVLSLLEMGDFLSQQALIRTTFTPNHHTDSFKATDIIFANLDRAIEPSKSKPAVIPHSFLAA